MTNEEAMKLALEALKKSIDLVSNEASEAKFFYAIYPTRFARVQGLLAMEVAHLTAIKTLEEALAKQEQDMPKIGCVNHDCDKCKDQTWAKAWDEGYCQGVEDERTSESNIGIAGFGAKVNPDRQNPYAKQEQEPYGYLYEGIESHTR